jgi:uncharacterized protein
MSLRGALRLAGLAAAALFLAAAALHDLGGAIASAQNTLTDSSVVPDSASIPAFEGYVTDQAHVLDDGTRAKLEAFLDQLDRKTGAEFAVLTVNSTAPETPDEYKVRVFERWKIGKRGEDNGLLMLFAQQERQLKFETGYGLEGVLPDGLQSRIFRTEMRPKFRDGDFAGGITAGVLECAKRIAHEKGVTLEWDGRELRYSGGSGDGPPLAALLVMAIVVIVVIGAIGSSSNSRGRRRRRYGGWDDWGGMGGWGGGFGGGLGGGWGGGGGGGGGSFGGFGGGSSGGGGGGGSW